MLQIPKQLEQNYLNLSGEYNYTGVNAASSELVGNAIDVIHEALIKPLGFISEQTFKASSNISRAFSRVSGRNAYEQFVKQGPQYFSLSKTAIQVPENLKGKLLPYVITVSEVQEELSSNLPKMISHLRGRVGTVYHDKKELTKPIDDFNEGFIDTKENVTKLKKVMSTEISNDTLSYGKVLDRNKDWVDIADALESIFKNASVLDINKIDKHVNELSELVDSLIEDRLVNEEIKVSSATISNLGKAVFELAECVRLYGVVYSCVIELSELDSIWQKRLGEVS